MGKVLDLLCRSFFLELPAASYNHYEGRHNVYNDENNSFDRAEGDLTIGKALELVMLRLPPASSSFLQLPTATTELSRCMEQ